MQKILAFLQLVRVNNLIILLATLVFSYYFLTDYLTIEDLFQPRFILLCLCIILTSAAGYIINDYYDINIDLTNKPEKVIIGKHISRRKAMFIHFIFSVVAFIIGLYLSWYLGSIIFFTTIVLWLYSVYFKKRLLSGNIIVAALSAFVLLVLPFFNPLISKYLVWIYSVFAFGVSLIREIVKDTEDLRGDSKFNCKTLPILFGVRKTKKVLIALNLVFIGLLLTHLFIANSYIPFRHQANAIVYIFYILLFLVFPLLIAMYYIYRADVKSDFSRLSLFYKIYMLIGIFSMVIIKL
ncbi:MAG: geranylgeranylglycerol-phosphate geranylgeranyltransferase [Bacteroidia bacterium]|nr:geranylgeranylglycerol-phosphate geranylgeranyltransferase [Bacteroidia bacterium]